MNFAFDINSQSAPFGLLIGDNSKQHHLKAVDYIVLLQMLFLAALVYLTS